MRGLPRPRVRRPDHRLPGRPVRYGAAGAGLLRRRGRGVHRGERRLRRRRHSGASGVQRGQGQPALSPPGQAGLFLLQPEDRQGGAPSAPPHPGGVPDQGGAVPLPPGRRPRRPLRREARRAGPAGEGPALPVPPLRRLRRGDGGAPAPAGEREKLCLDCFRAYNRFDV